MFSAIRKLFSAAPEAPRTTTPPGRNEPCHCGSQKKYKSCCLPKDQRRAAR